MPFFAGKRGRFTLIELVVVLAIIGLATSLVMTSFRGESDTLKRERIAGEFEAWLAQIRYRAMEQGREFVVRWDEERKRMAAQGEYSAAEEELLAEKDQVLPAALFWKIPEGCTFSPDEDTLTAYAEEHEYGREILRFYADGGAGFLVMPVLRCGKAACRFDFSPLTGALIVREGDGKNEAGNGRPSGFRTIEEMTGTAGEEGR